MNSGSLRADSIFLLACLSACSGAISPLSSHHTASAQGCPQLQPPAAPQPLSLVQKVGLEDVKTILITYESMRDLPGDVVDAQLKGLEEEWRRTFADLPTDAEFWWFEEEKDPILGGTMGVIAVQDCLVLAELVVLEDN